MNKDHNTFSSSFVRLLLLFLSLISPFFNRRLSLSDEIFDHAISDLAKQKFAAFEVETIVAMKQN